MAGKGKAGSRAAKPVTQSRKAGLVFPIGRVGRYMRKGRYSERVGLSGPVFMAGVLEYLTSEILELAGEIATEHKKMRILPRHLQMAVRTDDEFNKMLAVAQISQGGVMPNVNEYLFPQKDKKKGAHATQEM